MSLMGSLCLTEEADVTPRAVEEAGPDGHLAHWGHYGAVLEPFA